MVAVGLAALVAALRPMVAGRPGALPDDLQDRRGAWRPWVGGLLSVTGFAGYLAYVAVRTGRLDGWFRIQREGWGWYFDGGAATTEYVAAVLARGERVFDVLIVLALVGSIVLIGLAAYQLVPWPLLVYGALVLAATWGTDGLIHAKLRLLLRRSSCCCRWRSGWPGAARERPSPWWPRPSSPRHGSAATRSTIWRYAI